MPMKLERDSAILLDNKVKVLSLFVIDALHLSVKERDRDIERGKHKRGRKRVKNVRGKLKGYLKK